MGYLYMMAGLACGLGKGFCGKKMSVYVRVPRDAMLANTCRMLLCIAIGFLLLCVGEGAQALAVSARMLWVSLLSGVSTAAFVVFWVLAVQRGAYMLTDVFCTAGLILPLLVGVLFLEEGIKWTQWVGFGVLLVAVLVMCSYSTGSVKRLTPLGVLLLVLSGIGSGLSSLSQKLFVKLLPDGSSLVFNFYTYVFAAAVLLLCYLALRVRERDKPKEPFAMRAAAPYILVMAGCLFANSYFLTQAARTLDAVVLYPLSTGLALVCSTLMSALFFRERITAKALLGVGMTFVALIVINVL